MTRDPVRGAGVAAAREPLADLEAGRAGLAIDKHLRGHGPYSIVLPPLRGEGGPRQRSGLGCEVKERRVAR